MWAEARDVLSVSVVVEGKVQWPALGVWAWCGLW